MTEINLSASNEKTLRLAECLFLLARETGLQLTITIPPTKPEVKLPSSSLYDNAAEIKQHKREDLAWFQTYLVEHPDEFARLRDHYVAVYKKRIVSIGENKELVIGGAANSLKVPPEVILVVPVQMCSTDSQEDWQNIKLELDVT